MFNYSWRFEAAGARWRVSARYGMAEIQLRVFEGEDLRAERVLASGAAEALDPQTLSAETPQGLLEVTIGSLNAWSVGYQARLNGEMIARSSQKDFATFKGLKKMLSHQAAMSSEERAAMHQRAKDRMPSVYVDVAMGVVFFVVARQFGLPAAAVTGAAITLVLFIAQRFVKVDLLGGFAVFGVAISLLSAGAALAFQSDLAVKLRGTVIGLIVAGAFLTDGAFGGRYLGVRLAGYFESLMRLKSANAAFAMGCSGIVVAVIDLAAAFGLSGDAWLIYNAFLDGFIAVPLVFGALWLARERSPAR